MEFPHRWTKTLFIDGLDFICDLDMVPETHLYEVTDLAADEWDETIPPPPAHLSPEARDAVEFLVETACEAHSRVRRLGPTDDYSGLALIEVRDPQGKLSVIYAPRRGATICVVGAVATGRSVHPRGPTAAMAWALYIREEHAMAIEAGWSIDPVILARDVTQAAEDDKPNVLRRLAAEYGFDERLMLLGARMRARFGSADEIDSDARRSI